MNINICLYLNKLPAFILSSSNLFYYQFSHHFEWWFKFGIHYARSDNLETTTYVRSRSKASLDVSHIKRFLVLLFEHVLFFLVMIYVINLCVYHRLFEVRTWTFLMLWVSNLSLMLIGFIIRTRDMIFVSKSIYSSLGIQWCIYKTPKTTQSHSHINMCH